jgi:hypothetical protein
MSRSRSSPAARARGTTADVAESGAPGAKARPLLWNAPCARHREQPPPSHSRRSSHASLVVAGPPRARNRLRGNGQSRERRRGAGRGRGRRAPGGRRCELPLRRGRRHAARRARLRGDVRNAGRRGAGDPLDRRRLHSHAGALAVLRRRVAERRRRASRRDRRRVRAGVTGADQRRLDGRGKDVLPRRGPVGPSTWHGLRLSTHLRHLSRRERELFPNQRPSGAQQRASGSGCATRRVPPSSRSGSFTPTSPRRWCASPRAAGA